MANRLSGETSPYLRQHEDNPVDWYPWGDEAFARARELDRPILLSVGYSACHWCHVMAHESFEDPDTAALMNQWFVNIKVDREERPDVDALYMEAVQAMTGQGGWPMTMFLTPDGRPFFGGTYFPKTSMHGRPSFSQLLAAVDDAWVERRDGVEEQAREVSAHLAGTADLDGLVDRMGLDLESITTAGPDGVARIEAAPLLQHAVEQLLRSHDREWGGFGRAPKFPQTTMIDLLLRAHAHGADERVLDAVVTTLDAMASGGLYDHLGGGFARYSTDDRWLVPHFEKMLYDQAALLRAYTRGHRATGHDRYRQVVEETVTYLLRDLAQPGGAFSSAEDADSEGEEGRFYVWSLDELHDVLGPDLSARAARHWGVTARGNFEGHNILHLPERGAFGRDDELEHARSALLARREQRVRPGLDDKVLTEWNAMTIASLAEAAATFGRNDWATAAERAARFLLDELRTPEGRWLRAWHERSGARLLAYGADLAHLVDAFTRLHETTGSAEWIGHALDAASQLVELFVDHEQGGVFTVGSDAEQLLVRQRDLFDSATPSASSTAALALLRLGALTGEERLSTVAVRILQAMGPIMAGRPTGFTNALCALDLLASGTTEIAVAGDPTSTDTLELVRAVQRRFLPNAVLTWGEPFDSPLWEGRTTPGAPRVFVCRDFACAAPVSDIAALEQLLDREA